MQWIEIRLDVEAADEKILSDLLTELGAVAVTTSSADEAEVFEIDGKVTNNWPYVSLTGLFEETTEINQVCSQLALHTKAKAQLGLVKDQDWGRAWLDNFQPIKISTTLWVHPSWLAAPNPDAINLIIDPGMAFGTGTHESTRLCLVWLDKLNLNGLEVLDYGCGSGILAIASLKLGASHAIATDVEPRALVATQENARRNQVQIETYLPHELPLTTQADLVIANILAQTIISLKDRLQNHLKSGGQLLLSGILSRQAAEVMQALPDFSWQTSHDGDWVALLGKKND